MVLPDDMDECNEPCVYVHISDPKTRRRGARHQYTTVQGSEEVAFITAVTASMLPAERLYGASMAAFRLRFDRALQALKVPKASRFTPGGLRGGGAVAEFRRNGDIAKLKWKMRVTDDRILGHYLQEVNAITSLASLPAGTRDRISAVAALYPRMLDKATRELQLRSQEAIAVGRG